MSTTLLDATTGTTAGNTNGFRIILDSAGAKGVSIRVTTPSGGLDAIPAQLMPRLNLTSSAFEDGPTTAADIDSEMGGGGVITMPIQVSTTGDDVRYSSDSWVFAGPVIYGYTTFPIALSDDIEIEVEIDDL